MSFSSDSKITDVEEKTEVIYGADNIVNSTLECAIGVLKYYIL
jgi:hypothetical protein